MFNHTTVKDKTMSKLINVADYHIDAENQYQGNYLASSLGLSLDFVQSYNSWIRYNNELYYFKCIEIFNELFLAELAKEFNLKSLDYKLAKFNTTLGIVSKSFKDKEKTYSDYDYFFDTEGRNVPRDLLSLDERLSLMISDDNKKELMNDIYRLTAFDFFSGQTDRGDTNLIFETNDKVRLAPVFDNGSAMYFPRKSKNHIDLLFTNYYSSFDNLYFPAKEELINKDHEYLFFIINENEELYKSLCKALDISVSKVLKRTIEKYKLIVSKEDRKDIIDYFNIKKRIIDNTLTLAIRHK